MRGRRIDIARVASSALFHAEAIVSRWLPDGRREGPEWVARNPKRADKGLGSFKVNLRTGRWGDFAAGVGGGDFVSLGAYLHDRSQVEAAKGVAEMIGIDAYE